MKFSSIYLVKILVSFIYLSTIAHTIKYKDGCSEEFKTFLNGLCKWVYYEEDDTADDDEEKESDEEEA